MITDASAFSSQSDREQRWGPSGCLMARPASSFGLLAKSWSLFVSKGLAVAPVRKPFDGVALHRLR
jgi:hypothetical protein